MILAALAGPVHADPDCLRWAALVERLERMTPEAREQHQAEWLRAAGEGIAARYVMSALNWVRSGQSSRAAWAECRDDMT